MYQPYPGGDQPSQQPDQLGQSGAVVASPIPQSVTRAVQVMYLGALASLVGIIIELLTRHSLRNFIRDHATRNGSRLTAAQVADTYHAELVVLVVVGLIGIGLWLWMAQKNKAGKNWARITSTVFFALDTLGAIGGQPRSDIARFSASAISAAVSSRVPSRSNSTASSARPRHCIRRDAD